jgi:hypothetical protein
VFSRLRHAVQSYITVLPTNEPTLRYGRISSPAERNTFRQGAVHLELLRFDLARRTFGLLGQKLADPREPMRSCLLEALMRNSEFKILPVEDRSGRQERIADSSGGRHFYFLFLVQPF